jgi:cysteine desulfurase
LEGARARVAARTGRKPSEVVFTSGGSEADNLALAGAIRPLLRRTGRARLVISSVEHPAVAEPAAELEREGAEVVRIGVDGEGRLDLDALDRALPADWVAVMAVNNETGVVLPIGEVIARAQRAGARVHVDAVQAAGRVDLPLEAELLALSGHKLGAPKGIGVLLTRAGVSLEPSLRGGPQERGRRAGTEPVALAVGFARALEIALDAREAEEARLRPLRERLDAALSALPAVRILGAATERIAGTTAALFGGVEGESLLVALDLEGIAASSGSACSSGSLEPSPVLLAMGVPKAEALSAVRWSLGWASRESDVERVLEILPRIVERLRAAG